MANQKIEFITDEADTIVAIDVTKRIDLTDVGVVKSFKNKLERLNQIRAASIIDLRDELDSDNQVIAALNNFLISTK